MTDDQLRAIRERVERLPLTHRNWRARTIGQGRYAAWVVDYGDPEDDSERFDLFEDPPEAVARFVALCETDVPALLEEVARLKEDLQVLRADTIEWVNLAEFEQGRRQSAEMEVERLKDAGDKLYLANAAFCKTPGPGMDGEDLESFSAVILQVGDALRGWLELSPGLAALAGDAEKGVGDG